MTWPKLVPGLLLKTKRETYLLIKIEASSKGWSDEGWSCFCLESNELVWLSTQILQEHPWGMIEYPRD